ncbi:MAG: hybrid sensor histidine kinase/response regulator [Bacteroidetes bacterium]|nr:MAG: hybrid sensor histidine kinase/response regulator [Bacteroidota bacterium]
MRAYRYRRMTLIKGFCWMACFFLILRAQAQYVIDPSERSGSLSLHSQARIAATGARSLSFEEVQKPEHDSDFQPVSGPNATVGFTDGHYWVQVDVVNKSPETLHYFLETARPITDSVTLYIADSAGLVQVQYSGDKMPFSERAFTHRKTLFPIELPAGATRSLWIHYESDGETINVPLLLHTPGQLIYLTNREQIVFGVFYGIMLLAAIIYLFFFAAVREPSFLPYSLYVICAGLMQFSLDGFFYQYVSPDGGWFSQRAVLIFAILTTFFLGKYNELFLSVPVHSKIIYRIFQLMYVLVAVSFAALVIPSAIPPALYPAANVQGLALLLLIISTLVMLQVKRSHVDWFFTFGILSMVLGFTIFILNNFSVIPNSFIGENSSKLGTGLEVIFLSLSMANRIRLLRSEKEQMQSLALQRLEQMNELKSYFLSNMSHELRTPLNAVMNLADEMIRESDDPKVVNHSEVIKYASVGLLSSVNDILDFSKIEKGELSLEHELFDPVKLIEGVVYSAERQANDKGLDFTFVQSGHIPQMVKGDAVRLAQIVNNVLGNAIKFTSEGFVRIEMSGAEVRNRSQTRLVFCISDSGMGIPPDKLSTIYESFSQENTSTKRKFGGLGLGLSIVKALVDLHKGEIHISSEVNKGTTCRFVLPYETAPSSPHTGSIFPSKEYDLKGRHVLVVEDNPVNQLVMRNTLKKWQNTSAHFAANGAEAISILSKEPIDIILMDLQMPVMDGYEATLAIRRGQAGAEKADTPIIAVTADVMEETRRRVSEIGMNGYLTKPIDKQALYRRVTELLSERSSSITQQASYEDR